MNSNEYKRQWYHKNKARLRKYKAEYARQWRKDNPEKAKEKDRKYRAKYAETRNSYSKEYYEAHKDDPEFKGKRNVRSKKHYQENQDKVKARLAVGKALLRGELSKPQNCTDCGLKKPLEGHHNDYKKQLEVTWLCKACHEKLHHTKP